MTRQQSYAGLTILAAALEHGPGVVRALLDRGDPHRALAQARWLARCGVEVGELIAECERAIREKSSA